jgi:hypothetical protein
LLLCVTGLVAWPWLARDIVWQRIPDALIHLVRIYAVDAALGRGQGYPRWLGDLYLGYGYPLLNYYAPGLYYLGAGLHRLGLSVYASLQWAGVLAAAAGAAGAYALARALTRREDAARLAGAAYVLAPYPFYVNLYGRAAVPEALGLGLLPWLLLAGWRALYGPRRGRVPTLALAGLTAALLLTHNISAAFGLTLATLWLLAQPLVAGRPPAGGWRRLGAGVVLGLGLSAFFWLPAVLESGAVRLDLARTAMFDYRGGLFVPGRVPADELPFPVAVRAPAVQGFLDGVYGAVARVLPHELAVEQAVLAALAAAGAARAGRRGRPVWLWLLLGAGLWLLTTTWSAPIWAATPGLPLVQFPQRFNGPISLCVALAAAGGVAAAGAWRPGLRLGAALAVGLLALSAVAQRPYIAGPEPPHDVDARTLAGEEIDRFGAGTTSGGEFLPRTVHWEQNRPGQHRGLRLYDDAYPQAGWQAGLVRVLDGQGAATAVYQAPGWIAARVEAATPLRLAVHQLLFPGWRAYLDGQPVPVTAAPDEGGIDASLGFMVLEVPAGQHHVEVRFAATPPRALGAALSLATLVLVLGLAALAALAAREAAPPGRYLPALAVAVPLLAAACSLAGSAWDARPRLGPVGPAGAVAGRDSRVVLDVAGAVAAGRAETTAPGLSGQGALDPYLDVRFKGLPGPSGAPGTETRRWLYMHPPATASVRLRVPPDAYFQAGLGLDPAVWAGGADAGDGVRFVLEADGPGGRRVLMSRDLNPRGDPAARPWVDVWVDLSPLTGQDVRLTLRTEGRQDPNYDWAGWANPQVVRWTGARPDPGTPPAWKR